MPAPRGMSSFQGFESPSLDLNSPKWEDRLTVLYEQYQGRWAKYGPYTSKKSAQNTASHIRNLLLNSKNMYLRYLEPQFQTEECGHNSDWYLYIRVGEKSGVQEEGRSSVITANY